MLFQPVLTHGLGSSLTTIKTNQCNASVQLLNIGDVLHYMACICLIFSVAVIPATAAVVLFIPITCRTVHVQTTMWKVPWHLNTHVMVGMLLSWTWLLDSHNPQNSKTRHRLLKQLSCAAWP